MIFQPKRYGPRALWVLVVAVTGLYAGSSQAAERVFYLAAEDVVWDYAAGGRNMLTGTPYTEEEKVFVEHTAGRIGSRYLKTRYVEYADADFRTPKPRAGNWEHLGLLGPVLHAEVGDALKLVFRNQSTRPYSVHPHGVFYDKDSEGALTNDGTADAAKRDDAVPPGATYTYRWRVPERAGPGPADGSSIAWLYHSHVDAMKDVNAGLVGAIVVTKRGLARPDGSPNDVDREFVTLFSIVNENTSGHLDENIRRFMGAKPPKKDDEGFTESNLMHAVNGTVFGHLPGLDMRVCERVRWYVLALGSEDDLHTPHWHGNSGLHHGHRTDVVELLPASMQVFDMQPDAPGTWMLHCHVDDHMMAGMGALYRVSGEPAQSCPAVANPAR